MRKSTRAAVAGVSAALLAAGSSGCSNVDLGEIPFTCSGDSDCPSNYRCSAEHCIRRDAVDLPTLLDRSNAIFHPTIYPDTDRGGAISCWSRQEDAESPNGGVYAAFMGPTGHVSSAVRLMSFDNVGYQFRVSCAPVPHSDGTILIGAWLQANHRAETRLYLWKPTQPNGIEGTAEPIYSEVNPNISDLIPLDIQAGVVADQAWFVVYSQNAPYATGTHSAPINSLIRYRVGRAEAQSGIPLRDWITHSTLGSQFMRAIVVNTPEEPGWVGIGEHDRGFIAMDNVPIPASGAPVLVPQPLAVGEFGQPMASFGDQIAALWHDPTELPRDESGNAVTSSSVLGTAFRVGWVTSGALNVRFGPRLPFTRVQTPRPGAMRIGSYLYLFGAPTEQMLGSNPLSADAGFLGLPGADAAVLVSTATTSDTPRGPFMMYRVRWGASDRTVVEPVRRIPRRLGRLIDGGVSDPDQGELPVVSVSAVPLDDNRSFGLTWVEFWPADEVGHGIRYTMFMQKFPL